MIFGSPVQWTGLWRVLESLGTRISTFCNEALPPWYHANMCVSSACPLQAVIRANELLLFPTTPEVLWIVSDIQEKVHSAESRVVMCHNVPASRETSVVARAHGLQDVFSAYLRTLGVVL